jgi:hypothetical protein
LDTTVATGREVVPPPSLEEHLHEWHAHERASSGVSRHDAFGCGRREPVAVAKPGIVRTVTAPIVLCLLGWNALAWPEEPATKRE